MLRDDQTWATPSLLFKISLWNLHSKTSPSLLSVFPLKTNSLKFVYFLPKPKENVSAKYLPLLFLSSPVSHHLLPCASFRRHVILSNHHHGRATGAHHTFVSEAPWEVSPHAIGFLNRELPHGYLRALYLQRNTTCGNMREPTPNGGSTISHVTYVTKQSKIPSMSIIDYYSKSAIW